MNYFNTIQLKNIDINMLINSNNKQSSFFFYDYETFGLNPALDRPAQFAGIRVDNELQTIKEKKIFFCRLSEDYLPDPKSVLITGITPQDTLCNGLIESEFAHRIYQSFSTPRTCIVGYNNIHFDDEFSRNIFYRNFFDPYTWTYEQGNSRWDLLNVLRAYYTLYPNGIIWPLNNYNKPSLRLEDLTHANSIKHLNIHNANSDVFATLELAKLIKKTQSQLFQFLFNHRTKYQLQEIIDLDTISPLVFITNKINNKNKNFINYIAPISWHPINPNILIACDLNRNIDTLFHFNPNTMYHKLLANQITIYDIAQYIPLYLIKLNACPILIPIRFFNEIKTNSMKNTINYQHYLRNLNLIRTHKNNIHLSKKIKALYKIIEFYMWKKNPYKNTHVDNQLYRRFFNNTDRKIIKNIRKTNPQELTKLSTKNVDTRLTELLFYYRARNFPNTLNKQEQIRWLNYKKNKLFNKNQSRYYNDELNKLLFIHKHNTRNTKLIYSLKKYYQYLYESIL